MQLTDKQQEGLELAVARYRSNKPYTVIAGYAGTGKSTLVKFIISALGIEPEDVAYVAFTGKAANVLAKKGCPNATTAHKLLYYSKQLPNGKFLHKPKSRLEPYKLIVVDEISMLPIDMWQLLLKHHIPIICCGDPAQLPPINPDTDNHVLDNPHIFLDEIMRQAAESEIIRLSMHVREGNSLYTFNGENKEIQIVNKSDVVSGMYEWADQILCATNRKKDDVNGFMKLDDTPQEGDKIIGLRNNWNVLSVENQTPLTNGTIGLITDYYVEATHVPRYIFDEPIQIMYTTFQTEDGDTFYDVPIDYNYLITGKSPLNNSQKYKLAKNQKCIDPPLEFDYGYGITCHKSQGSEWDKVLVFEDSFPFAAEEHRRWLYTAITRASEKLVIVRK